jgi:hypothetical protein
MSDDREAGDGCESMADISVVAVDVDCVGCTGCIGGGDGKEGTGAEIESRENCEGGGDSEEDTDVGGVRVSLSKTFSTLLDSRISSRSNDILSSRVSAAVTGAVKMWSPLKLLSASRGMGHNASL